MSTGSAASDAEDLETSCATRRRSGALPITKHRHTDFSDQHLEEDSAGGPFPRGRKATKPGVSRAHHHPQPHAHPHPHQRDARHVQRSAANARERARMRVLSSAFCRLKSSLPWVPRDTKLSKLDTLRLASSYISHLRQLLQGDRLQDGGFVHPVNLTWPFMMSGRPEDHEDISTPGRLCGATA